jgi:hypothetical protein
MESLKQNNENAVITHKISFTKYCQVNNYKLKEVVPDGHCLVWAVLYSNDGKIDGESLVFNIFSIWN